jgi:peroxin-6
MLDKRVDDAGAPSGESAFSAGAIETMTRLSEATRFKGAVEFGIQPCLLISGARGSGKFTMASSIARQLGIHITEVR